MKLAPGWNVRPVPPPVITTVPLAGWVTAVMLRVSPESGAVLSLASTAMAVAAESSATVMPVSSVAVGASLTDDTAIEAVSVLIEKALAPPLGLVFTLLPALPLLWSQARKVMAPETVPLKLAAGWKYSRVFASAASSRAEASETAPTASQLAPLSVE